MQLNNLPDHILRIHLQFTTFRLVYGVPYIQVSKFISRAIQPTLICLILHSICRNVDPPCKMSLLVIRFPNLSSQLCIILFDVWLSWLFIVLPFTFYLLPWLIGHFIVHLIVSIAAYFSAFVLGFVYLPEGMRDEAEAIVQSCNSDGWFISYCSFNPSVKSTLYSVFLTLLDKRWSRLLQLNSPWLIFDLSYLFAFAWTDATEIYIFIEGN